jgi:hypothetical protein
MIKLSGEMVNAADSNLIGGFVRIYHRAIGFVSASPKVTWAKVWQVDEFNTVYAELVDFINLYPKNDPIYNSSPKKLDILRCHVTFVNKFVRKWPSVARLGLAGKPNDNVISERITRELSSVTDEKENRVVNPLYIELQQLVKSVGQQRHDNAALRQIYLFKKRNPDYDMSGVLSEQSNYLGLYIERQMERLAEKEASNITVDLTVDETAIEHNLTYYDERLTELRERAGLAPIAPDKVTPLVSPTKATQHSEPDSVEPVTPEKEKKRMTSDELEKLRARLNRLRN